MGGRKKGRERPSPWAKSEGGGKTKKTTLAACNTVAGDKKALWGQQVSQRKWRRSIASAPQPLVQKTCGSLLSLSSGRFPSRAARPPLVYIYTTNFSEPFCVLTSVLEESFLRQAPPQDFPGYQRKKEGPVDILLLPHLLLSTLGAYLRGGFTQTNPSQEASQPLVEGGLFSYRRLFEPLLLLLRSLRPGVLADWAELPRAHRLYI